MSRSIDGVDVARVGLGRAPRCVMIGGVLVAAVAATRGRCFRMHAGLLRSAEAVVQLGERGGAASSASSVGEQGPHARRRRRRPRPPARRGAACPSGVRSTCTTRRSPVSRVRVMRPSASMRSRWWVRVGPLTAHALGQLAVRQAAAPRRGPAAAPTAGASRRARPAAASSRSRASFMVRKSWRRQPVHAAKLRDRTVRCTNRFRVAAVDRRPPGVGCDRNTARRLASPPDDELELR